MQLSVARIAPVAAAPGALDRGVAPAGAALAGAGTLASPADRITLSASARAEALPALGAGEVDAPFTPGAEADAGPELRPLGARAEEGQGPGAARSGRGAAGTTRAGGLARASGRRVAAAAGRQLTVEQQRVVAELAARDRQVRAHEAAHMAAGGALTGGARYAYQTGPDGKQYAVGGEVSVQLRAGLSLDETIAHAEQVRAAALAPADPSAQDLAVAAAAAALELEARAAKARQAAAAYRSAGAGDAGGGAPTSAPAVDGAAA